jgi:lia operon protein LiaG
MGKGGKTLEKKIPVLLGLIGLISLSLIFWNPVDFSWWPFGKPKNQSVTSEGIDMIEMDISGVSTTIIPKHREDIKADLDGKGKLTVKRQGDKVSISVERKRFGWPFHNKAKLNLYIPEDYDRNMVINLGSGNLSFSGHSKNKPMKLDKLLFDVSSGNVKLKNISVQRFEHDSSSGNADIDSLTAESGTFDIRSGNLKVRHYSGAIEADLSSGNVSMQMDELTGAVDIEVSSGGVDLHLPKSADFTLNGKTSSGNITCDFPLTKKKIEHKSIKGVHGSGEHPIDLNVSSGHINIY